MAKHTVKLEDIKGFTTEVELAGSYGKGACKSLKAQISIGSKEVVYKISEHNNVVATEQDIEKAIEIYNEL